jgi:hypothetical protein
MHYVIMNECNMLILLAHWGTFWLNIFYIKIVYMYKFSMNT